MKFFKWFLGFIKRKNSSEDDPFFRPILFLFPNVLKESVSSDEYIEDWGKDYLSKHRNVEKYIHGACEALQICGISYTKYTKELDQYTDKELNQGIGEIVGRNFEIEARLMLRRILELSVESWHFKEIIDDKEKHVRNYFLLKNLKAFYSRKSNTEKFCDFKLEFDSKVIAEIREELNKLNIQSFNQKSDKDFNKDDDVLYLLKSFNQLLREAMPNMPDGLREMIGESYQLYAETSEVVHGFSGGPNFNLHNYHQEILALYARSGVLASNILKHLIMIGEGHIDNAEIVDAISGIKTGGLPPDFTFSVGDKVLVLRQIQAEIVQISQSKYGCKKFKVKYNDKRGDWNWTFDREWFLLKEISKL